MDRIAQNNIAETVGHAADLLHDEAVQIERERDDWSPGAADLATGILLALVSGRAGRALAVMFRDAGKHRSPNAGWPEAAMAQSNDIALAGPRSYDGELRVFAWVNAQGKRDLGPADIDHAILRLWQAWGFMLGGVIAMGAAIVVLFFLPWLDRSPVKSIRYRSVIYKIALAIFVVSFVVLGYLGTQPATPTFTFFAQVFSGLYFAFFILMPLTRSR